MPVGQLRPLRNRAEGNAHPNANGDRLGRSGSVGSATRRAAENRLPLRPSRPRRRRWSRVAASELLRVPQTAPRAVHLLRERGQPPYRSDRSTRSRRYAAISNLRVSELTGLRIDDVALPSMSIRVHGKGRRERALPLWKTTATALHAWLVARGGIAVPEVFVNVRGKPLSRWGFAYLLKQHAEAASLPSAAEQASVPARFEAYLRDDRAACDTGHPQGVPVARTQQPGDHRNLHTR